MSRLHEIALLPTNNQNEIKQLSHLINKKCKEGYTPLALAVYKKGTRTENIAEMLNLGADANTGKGSHGGVLHFAANTGRVDVVKLPSRLEFLLDRQMAQIRIRERRAMQTRLRSSQKLWKW